MKNQKETRHLIDILFVLSLFCVFALSSVILIIFGADIYKKNIQQMDSNYATRTSIAYISEKIRQSDTSNGIQITYQNETPVLLLTSTINNIPYATSLYEYNGYLYELFARTDIELPLDAGQPIMELQNLSFKQITPNILEVCFTDTNAENLTIYVSIHSAMEESHE